MIRSMQRELTPFQRNLLESLATTGRVTGFNKSHASRALRELEQRGLVSQSYSAGRWSLRDAGRRAVMPNH